MAAPTPMPGSSPTLDATVFALGGGAADAETDRELLRFARELDADRVPLALVQVDRGGAAARGLAELAGVVVDEVGADADPLARAIEELRAADPARILFVSDEPGAVAAARAAGIGLVAGIVRGESGITLRERGADWIVRDVARLTADRAFVRMAAAEHARPNPLAAWPAFAKGLAGRRMAVFLDYDGTLAPIVARPELARLSVGMRESLAALASACATFVVSGRDLRDVRRLVAIEGIAYAGSHGFDIDGPELRFEVDPAIAPRIEAAASALGTALAAVRGARVEAKRFSVAVHHREVAAADVATVERAVDIVLAAIPGLRKTLGKKVFELRPDLDWDKGRAVLWMIERLGLDDALPLYVGDDVTDEDAFRAIAGRGIGVFVADTPMPTAAEWWLQDVEEVEELLRRVAAASSPVARA